MATDIEFYSNNNGKIQRGSKQIPGNLDFDEIMRDFFLGDGSLADRFFKATPVSHNRAICSDKFPVASEYIDSKTKELFIDIAACGIKKEEVKVDVDNDTIIVEFKKDAEAQKSRLYMQKGLKLVTDETLKFKFDPMFHDPNTAAVTLEDGILSISLSPREEVKPIRKTIFGIAEKPAEETKSEEPTDEDGPVDSED